MQTLVHFGTLKNRGIDLGIIAVPGDATQDVANELIDVGIKAILNLAPRHISVPADIKVTTVNIALYLARLPYYVPAR